MGALEVLLAAQEQAKKYPASSIAPLAAILTRFYPWSQLGILSSEGTKRTENIVRSRENIS